MMMIHIKNNNAICSFQDNESDDDFDELLNSSSSDDDVDSVRNLASTPLENHTREIESSIVSSTMNVFNDHLVENANPIDYSDDDDPVYNEVQEVTIKASDLFEFMTVHQKKCHCHCQLFNGEQCILQFSNEEQDTIKMNVQEMTSYEKDLLLLGIISCSISATDSLESEAGKKYMQENSNT